MDKSNEQKFWASQIASAKHRESKWRKQGTKIVDIYRSGIGRNHFNILWANTEILKAATLSNISPPSVTRRHRDEDPTAKQASDIPKKQTFYTVMKIGCYAVEKGLTEHEAAKALSDMASTKEVLDGR